MKEIEEQILARKDELSAASSKPEKKDKKGSSDDTEGGSDEIRTDTSSDDILADIDEDFEEFTPADE